jgi:hypothetical protein
MTMIEHKTFLHWLLYISVIAVGICGLLFLQLPQLVVSHDHSYLSVVLIAMYAFAELAGCYQAVRISRLQRILLNTLDFLKINGNLNGVMALDDGSTRLSTSSGMTMVIPACIFSEHINALLAKSKNSESGSQLNQRILIDSFSEKVYFNAEIVDFVASRIVWVGILATILGVIIAFWPFLQAGLNIDALKNNIAGFFSGVAVAFIPTAVSFVFKIALDINSRILMGGVNEIVENATIASESYIIPYLERT